MGEEEVQREAGTEEVEDRHPDKGLVPGSSKDGLGHEVVTEARDPVRLSAPFYGSKGEREEHERTHMPYRCWCRCTCSKRNLHLYS